MANITKRLKENLIKSKWYDQIGEFFETETYQNLNNFIMDRRKEGAVICPDMSKVFMPFFLTPFDKVRVIVIGDEPYCTPNTSNGLAFGTNGGLVKPPALSNIINEVERTVQHSIPVQTSFHGWAQQGVLMMNTTMTTEVGIDNAHVDRGWESFSTYVLMRTLSQHSNIVCLFWGERAKSLIPSLSTPLRVKHKLMEASSPASYSFLSNKHLTETNMVLKNRWNSEAIRWNEIDTPSNRVLPPWTDVDGAWDKIKIHKDYR